MLKTLEEPPERVILLLTADSLESLLPTIVSRCQVIGLRPVSREQIVLALRARGVDSSRARLLAHLARGRVGWAIDASQDEHLFEQRDQLFDELREVLDGGYVQRFAWAEALSKEPERAREVLSLLSDWWRDVLVMSAGSDVQITNVDRESELVEWAARYGPATSQRVLKVIRETVWRLDHNANQRLALEVLALDLPGRR
jgi:DNA polymerase-3 subunit delta'